MVCVGMIAEEYTRMTGEMDEKGDSLVVHRVLIASLEKAADVGKGASGRSSPTLMMKLGSGTRDWSKQRTEKVDTDEFWSEGDTRLWI